MQDAMAATELRRVMVDCQIRPFDVTDRAVLGAMLSVPREIFVGAENAPICFSDAALTVSGDGAKRRLLAPMTLARMLQEAAIGPSSRVLDVAGGAGYSAALIASLAREVVALEEDAGFVRRANENFGRIGLANARAVMGPLDRAPAGSGPFDVIFVNGAVEDGLEGLFSALAPGGRLLAVQRSPGQGGRAGRAVRFDRIDGKTSVKRLFDASASVLPGFAANPAFAF